jgi:hypothetical protein
LGRAPRLRASFEARRGKEVFAFTVPKTAAGASLFGAAAFIIVMRKYFLTISE